MRIYGKEYGFRLDVKAQADIAKLCPAGDIRRFNEIFKGAVTAEMFETVARVCVIMSEAYERRQCFEDLEHKFEPLPLDVAMSLDEVEFEQLQNEALARYSKDSTPTVETEPEKKTNAAAE